MRLWYATVIIVYRLYLNMLAANCLKAVKCIATSTGALTRLKVFKLLFQKNNNSYINNLNVGLQTEPFWLLVVDQAV